MAMEAEVKPGEELRPEEMSEEELEKRGWWWWVAEKKRSKRLDYLRKAVWYKGPVGGVYPCGRIDLYRAKLFTEACKKYEDEMPFVRKAKAMVHVLENIPIFITDHAMLVGYTGSDPDTICWHPEMSSFLNEEVYNDPVVIPDEETKRQVAEIADYWKGKAAADRQIKLMDPETVVKYYSGVIGWGIAAVRSYANKTWLFFMPRGIKGIIAEIDKRIEEAKKKISEGTYPEQLPLYEKIQRWEAMKLVLQAASKYIKRYARLARIVAENFEKDPKRREELLKIAEVCEWISWNPPRNLHESLQFDHFIRVVCRLETYEGADPHWPDFVHWPYYKKDVIEEKNLTEEEAIELIGEFMIRTWEFSMYGYRWLREGLQGIFGTWVWTLGGQDENGRYDWWPLTIAFLRAARLVRVCNPTFAFRWHPKVPDIVMREVFECIRQGLGYPSIRNDPILIQNGMYWHKHPYNEMVYWVHQACMSPCPITKAAQQPFRMASATLDSAKIIEYAIFQGFDNVVGMQIGLKTPDPRECKTFEEFYEKCWLPQARYLMSLLTRSINFGRYKNPEFDPNPFLSAISERSVEQGEDICSVEGERGNSWITFFTWVENVDSLAAIKKLIYDEKKYTWDQLIEALKNNWEGYEEMRLDFVKNAPKWGNDDDYVDSIMVKCLEDLAKISWELKDPTGNPWPILPENVSGSIHYSSLVWALPNGRRLGDPLYDGGISPGYGLDKKGPTAVLKSCSKFSHIKHGRAFLLNQRLSPSQMAGEKGYQLWKAYIRTWADLGLDHVQFNCVDDKTLRAAQREPEKYQELIVRVAGYSAHFVQISRKTQDSIIQRTIQDLASMGG